MVIAPMVSVVMIILANWVVDDYNLERIGSDELVAENGS